jgi:hypothetical protein
MKEFLFDVFGRRVAIVGETGGWRAFYLGNEGKRRRADFIVPPELAESALAEYLDDLFHESATPQNPTVRRLA